MKILGLNGHLAGIGRRWLVRLCVEFGSFIGASGTSALLVTGNALPDRPARAIFGPILLVR